MALWLRSNNKLYIPPSPVAKIKSTDEYITRTNVFYHAGSERLLTVGHPFYEIKASDGTVKVPKVSPNQYRVFKILLPDPNKFAFPNPSFYNVERERLVWAISGLEIGRGQPLGPSITGNPLFNKYDDVENPSRYASEPGKDERQNVAFDTKQTQTVIVGCVPAKGEHWGAAEPCLDESFAAGDCPPLELVDSIIQDGDMADIGFGAMDFRTLQQNRSDAPLDVLNGICKYPDYIQMNNDPYGDSMFFFARREQMYTRHYFNRGGVVGEPPAEDLLYKAESNDPRNTVASSVYGGTPSGSLVSSDVQIFNRPFWIQRTQGNNNGVCWGNVIYLTVVDNTRGTSFSINRVESSSLEAYDSTKFRQYLRHVEEFEISIIIQLCRVPLDTEVLSHIYSMSPRILEDWNLGVNIPAQASIEDRYRFIKSTATPCPESIPAKPDDDPYSKYIFWTLDFQERLSAELDQYALGRKFIYQSGLYKTMPSTKRVTFTAPTKRTTKRRRA
ncbi:L1 [Boa constrictor papillomavirus 1]|uniref:L1 n=1 Tax=Boa constrictor papillomavirus 1 TaxID=2294156 RepID=UPI000E3327DB|nr:L1 [Boa constrictor papillomavirus 1]AXL96277.1 L1 [Boa constrictor papillomavirus 1]